MLRSPLEPRLNESTQDETRSGQQYCLGRRSGTTIVTVGTALRCEESNQGANKHERRNHIRTVGWRQSLRENVETEGLW